MTSSVDWLGRIVHAMNNLDKEFRENELAYLALTSKAERQIVDRLAFSLHRDYGGNDDVVIAREFTIPKKIQRVDLAIVQDRTPHLFLEAKAMQSLNVNLPRESRKYRIKIEEDRKKLREFQSGELRDTLNKVVLHLTTHSSESPDEKWNGIVKYSGRIRKHRPKSIDELKAKLDRQLPAGYFPIKASGDILGGRAFDMEVIVHFRLFGPY